MGLLTPILTGMASNWVRIAVWGGLALFIGFLLWSAFIKPTHSQTNTTQVQDGGKAQFYWQGATVNVSPFSCARFDGKPREIKK